MSAADAVIEPSAETPLEAARALRWTALAIATITVLLLVFNSASLRSWADDLPPNEATLQLRALADGWDDAMRSQGLAAPRDAVHALWKKAEAAHF